MALADGTGGFAAPRLGMQGLGLLDGWSSQTLLPRMLGDVNGDGRADIVGFGLAGPWVALADGTGGFAAPQLALRAFGLEAGWNDHDLTPRFIADVTGDGRADAIAIGAHGPLVDILFA